MVSILGIHCIEFLFKMRFQCDRSFFKDNCSSGMIPYFASLVSNFVLIHGSNNAWLYLWLKHQNLYQNASYSSNILAMRNVKTHNSVFLYKKRKQFLTHNQKRLAHSIQESTLYSNTLWCITAVLLCCTFSECKKDKRVLTSVNIEKIICSYIFPYIKSVLLRYTN